MRTGLILAAVVTGGCQHTPPADVSEVDAAAFVARINRAQTCLRGLEVSVSDHGAAMCVSYSPKQEPGHWYLGPEGIVCVHKKTARVEKMIFHGPILAPCPAETR